MTLTNVNNYFGGEWKKFVKDKSLIPAIIVLLEYEKHISDGYDFYTGGDMVSKGEDELEVWAQTTLATLEEIAEKIETSLQ